MEYVDFKRLDNSGFDNEVYRLWLNNTSDAKAFIQDGKIEHHINGIVLERVFLDKNGQTIWRIGGDMIFVNYEYFINNFYVAGGETEALVKEALSARIDKERSEPVPEQISSLVDTVKDQIGEPTNGDPEDMNSSFQWTTPQETDKLIKDTKSTIQKKYGTKNVDEQGDTEPSSTGTDES